MAFEKLAPYIDFIEESFGKKKSPRAIANELGQPGLYSTINRYKVAVWGMKDLVGEAKEERASKHDEKHDQAVQEVVSTLELIELGKLRAKQLMSVNLGEEFDVSDGQKHRLTLGSASIYWPTGMQMARDAAKLEMELVGDDPESRKANAIESLSEAEIDARLSELLNIIDSSKTDKDK